MWMLPRTSAAGKPRSRSARADSRVYKLKDRLLLVLDAERTWI